MSTTAILLVVLSAAIHAGRDFLTKKAGDKQLFMWWYQVVGLLFFSPVFAYFAIREGIEIPATLSWCLVSGVVYFLYWFFLAKAYEAGDLSRVYPIVRSAPALVLGFSVLVLDESVSLLGGLGVGLTATGVYTINMERLSPGTLLAPLRSIVIDRSTRYAFLTLLSVTAYSIIDKLAVDRIHPVVYLFLLSALGSVFFTLYILKTKGRAALGQAWRADRKSILLNSLFVHYGYVLILIAFTLERLSYVVGLRQLSVVFAVLLGGHLLQEEHKMIRFISALVIVAGALLISMAG